VRSDPTRLLPLLLPWIVACISDSGVGAQDAAREVTIAKRPPVEWLAQFKAADEAGRKQLIHDAFGGAAGFLPPELVPTLLGWLEHADPVMRGARSGESPTSSKMIRCRRSRGTSKTPICTCARTRRSR